MGPPASHVIETEVGDEISLYDPKTEQVTVMNVVASDVWRLADGTLTLEAIVDLLATAYSVDPEDIRSEVATAVETFRLAGLLHEEP